MAQEKTEQPTPKKRREAREEGQVAKSKEVTSALTLFVGFMALFMFMGAFLQEMQRLMVLAFTGEFTFEVTFQNVFTYLVIWVRDLGLTIMPIFLVVACMGLISEAFQTRLIFSAKSLKPDFKKLNPINGVKQIISKRALVELVKSILKALSIAYISYITIYGELSSLLHGMDMGIEATLLLGADLIFQLALRVSLFLLALSLLDYLFQRWEHENKLKMTKQEVKDERKNIEGDPLVQAEIRRRQREMAMNRMMQDVPEADVVITNPTHIAVAIRYQEEEMLAPRLVAKGEDYLAERIIEVAREYKVEIVENKELAWALYESTEIGDEIPTSLYQGVAEILAFIYRLKHQI